MQRRVGGVVRRRWPNRRNHPAARPPPGPARPAARDRRRMRRPAPPITARAACSRRIGSAAAAAANAANATCLTAARPRPTNDGSTADPPPPLRGGVAGGADGPVLSAGLCTSAAEIFIRPEHSLTTAPAAGRAGRSRLCRPPRREPTLSSPRRAPRFRPPSEDLGRFRFIPGSRRPRGRGLSPAHADWESQPGRTRHPRSQPGDAPTPAPRLGPLGRVRGDRDRARGEGPLGRATARAWAAWRLPDTGPGVACAGIKPEGRPVGATI